MDPVELTDDELTLRCWRPDDAPAVYRACQDPDIQRWTTVPSPYAETDAVRFVTGAPAAWADGSVAAFGVFDAASGELLGSQGLDLAGGAAELGYWTAPWARGRGVTERAGRLVLAWAFDALGLHRVRWRAVVGNHASRLVAARLGMRPEGVVRSGLVPHDGTAPQDGWLAGMLPGELRPAGPDGPTLARAARQARTYLTAQPTIEAGRYLLRPLTETDVPALVELCRDPAMAEFTTVPVPYQPSHAAFFVRLARDRWVAGDGAIFAVAEPTGRLLGTMDLRLVDWPARIADIGYSVAPWARGRGVGTTGLRAVCDWAFDALAVDRIEWRAYVTNPASRRVAEKAGFTVEGTERGHTLHRGTPVDTSYGAKLATDPR
jgi:RimJ/RimL family protein N-acetyltransferase